LGLEVEFKYIRVKNISLQILLLSCKDNNILLFGRGITPLILYGKLVYNEYNKV